MDIELIRQCADPALRPEIVEQFITAAGSPDPLTITVKSGNRLILVPTPKTVDQALAIVQEHVGRAEVRAGHTMMPAGIGVSDVSAITGDLFNPCDNLRKGTAMFAKIMRIVAKWYGNPSGKEALAQVFDDAAYAWKTGEFEGVRVFLAADPGGGVEPPVESPVAEPGEEKAIAGAQHIDNKEVMADPHRAGIRIDLYRSGQGQYWQP